MSAHPSQSPARNEDAPTRIVTAQHDPSANLLALADAIEACLQVSVASDNGIGEEHTLALNPSAVIVRPLEAQRVLTTQPLSVQAKPTAIFASRLPAHFVAPSAPGAVVITATPAIAPPEKTAVEAPRKQTLFVQPVKRRSKAPWLAVATLLIAAVGVGGYVERGHIQQYRAQMAAKPAPAAPVAQIAQPQATPVVTQPQPAAVTTPVLAQPVVEPVVAVVAQPAAQPAAEPEAQPVTARVKHRETHARKPDAKPASDTAQASNDTKPEPRGEAKPESKPDMKAAADAMLKAQLDSAL